MLKRTPIAFLVLALSPALTSCGRSGASSSPAAPSPTSQALPSLTSIEQVSGIVSDTAFRPLAGATVSVVDGPRTGASTTADATGRFSLTGPFTRSNSFRATQDGHTATTQALTDSSIYNCNSGGCAGSVQFYLDVIAPPLDIGGDYNLTFTVDAGCADFPAELRTRTYAAHVALAPISNQASNTRFALTTTDAQFLKHDNTWTYNNFPIGVADHDLSLFLYGRHNPAIVERLGPNTYLAFSGTAAGSLASAASTFATSFDGWIEYCVMKSDMSGPYNCGLSDLTGEPIPGAAITRVQCDSPNHRLTMTRR